MKQLLLFLLVTATFSLVQGQATYYVTQAGGGDGSSWIAASGNLQDVINNASSGDSVFVAGGIYTAPVGGSFSMKQGVKIYGSFAGTEGSLTDRNLAAGDTSILQGSGSRVILNNVTSLDRSSVLDGFKITGGNSSSGGGIYNSSSSPTLTNLIISGNTAYNSGGGMYNTDASPLLINCLFANNTAPEGEAIANSSGNGTLINTTLIGSGKHSVFYAYGWTFWKNCIVWGAVEGSNYNVSYSLLSDNSAKIGTTNHNINASTFNATDVFTDFTGGDFSLKSASPAIDAGTPDTTGLSLPLVDLAGHPRIVNDRIDIGAYENQDGAALPVTIKGFAGTLQGGLATLAWQSGVEANFRQYELEKSLDGSVYKLVATIASKGDNRNYSYSTPQTEATAYYRLNLIEDNGQSKYYNQIVSLSGSLGATNLFVYPSPAGDYIHIKIPQEGTIQIYDAAGRLVKTQGLSAGLNRINVSGLSAGIYYGVVNGQKLEFVKQ